MACGCKHRPRGFTPDQMAALSITADELGRLAPDVRASLYLRHLDVRANQRGAFWSAVGALATAAALFGIVGSR